MPAKQKNHTEAAVEGKPIKKASAKSTTKQVTVKKENSKSATNQASTIIDLFVLYQKSDLVLNIRTL